MQSFLKWPGGKRWLAPLLAAEVSARLAPGATYIEPFLGGASVFFHLEPERAVLSDTNAELISTLRVVAEDPRRVLDRVWRWSNTRECYERVRSMRPRSSTVAAARFIYLNRTGWGGMYRVNAKGEFNVPFGDSGRVVIRRQRFMDCARLLTRAHLEVNDFGPIIDCATDGDVVYADPPYVQDALRGEVVFNRYGSIPFNLEDEKRLAYAAHEARDRGVFVCISSFWTERSEHLWRAWPAVTIDRASNVSRYVPARRHIREVVIFSEEPRADWGQHFRI